MAGGRPTDYREEFCEQIIAFGKQGFSLCEMASEFEVIPETLYEWAKKYPEFTVSFARARRESQTWWEKKGRDYLVEVPNGPRINSGLYSRSMAARFPDDWRESKNLDVKSSVTITTGEHDADL